MINKRRLLLFVTTNNDESSLSKLSKMLFTVKQFADHADEVKVRVHLLLQNATPNCLIELAERVPQFVCLHSIDMRVPLSKARNIMLRAERASGLIDPDDVVGYPDDDCWFPAGTLSHISRRFTTNSELDFWYCRYGTAARGPSGVREIVPRLQEVVSKASSNTMFFRGRVVNAIGEFDEELGVGSKTNGGEDTDYALRAFYVARQTRFLDETLVWHRDFDPTLKARYFPGSLVAILRYAGRSHDGMFVGVRKLLIGVVLIAQNRLTFKEFFRSIHQASNPRPRSNEAEIPRN